LAEGAPVTRRPGFGDRRLLYIAAVGVVFLFIFIMIMVRTCGVRPAGPKYTVIYSNLELKDAADVISRLKELRIPYEIRDEGRSVAVPREKADEARIGLAEEGLPVGGAVGWEIFDETKLGATDFDRRIQFIRAISGELARTIRHIDAVDEARVQIVIPETRLFEAAKAPVTASVLLKLRVGKSLTASQINGIIHLVASSVENLKPENVTVVDVYGNILSGEEVAVAPPSLPEALLGEKEPEIKEFALLEKKEKEIKEREESLTKKEKELEKKLAQVELEKIAKPEPLTPEERALLRLKLKNELEEDLASNAQTLLNKFYPPNTVVVKVNIETGPPKVEYIPEEVKLEKLTKKELTLRAKEVISINRITAVVLMDNRIELTEMQKKDIYQTVAGAIGYSRSRGDKIILRRVPFHYAIAPPQGFKPKLKEEGIAARLKGGLKNIIYTLRRLFTKEGIVSASASIVQRIGRKNILKVVALILAVIFGIYVVRKTFKRGKKKEKVEKVTRERPPKFEAGVARVREGLKDLVETEPEKLAHLLETWLTEEA